MLFYSSETAYEVPFSKALNTWLLIQSSCSVVSSGRLWVQAAALSVNVSKLYAHNVGQQGKRASKTIDFLQFNAGEAGRGRPDVFVYLLSACRRVSGPTSNTGIHCKI